MPGSSVCCTPWGIAVWSRRSGLEDKAEGEGSVVCASLGVLVGKINSGYSGTTRKLQHQWRWAVWRCLGSKFHFLALLNPSWVSDTRCQVLGDPHICWILLGRPSILHSPLFAHPARGLRPHVLVVVCTQRGGLFSACHVWWHRKVVIWLVVSKHFLFSIIYGIILPNWLSYFSRWLKTTSQLQLP